MIQKQKETGYFATTWPIFKLVGNAVHGHPKAFLPSSRLKRVEDQWLSTGGLMRAVVPGWCIESPKREGVMPDERSARLYRAVESLGDAIRTDDLETAERYREQLSAFYDAPYATTGEALGDAVAEFYKVTGWWLRNFRDRPEYKQQALRSGELIIGLLDA